MSPPTNNWSSSRTSFSCRNCCPTFCSSKFLHVLSSVLWCQLQFLHENDVRLELQLFVGGLMSYLRYLCLFVYSGVQYILFICFLFCFSSSCVPYVASFSGLFLFYLSSSCVPYVASFSGLSILVCPFSFL
jgi:hypothetical protein